MNKFSKNQKVTIYYNNLTLGDRTNGHRVHENCPSVDVPWRQATEYAEKKISSKGWSVYLIPELNSLHCTFEGKDTQEEEKEYITCPNQCSKEELDEDNYEGTGMFKPYFLNGVSSRPEYICNICMSDAIIV